MRTRTQRWSLRNPKRGLSRNKNATTSCQAIVRLQLCPQQKLLIGLSRWAQQKFQPFLLLPCTKSCIVPAIKNVLEHFSKSIIISLNRFPWTHFSGTYFVKLSTGPSLPHLTLAKLPTEFVEKPVPKISSGPQSLSSLYADSINHKCWGVSTKM